MSAVVASSAAKGSVVDPVRALQHSLYRSAKADPGRRIHALRDKVYRRDVLWRACVMVYRNNGAPGIDGTSLADVKEYGVERLLDEVADELRNRRWQPSPSRRVLIPKPGSSDTRPLSIPSVRDRMVRQRSRSCSSRSLKPISCRAVSGFARNAQHTMPCKCSLTNRGGGRGG